MDDETLVRMRRRRADLQEQARARAQFQRAGVAPAVCALALDIFQRQERITVDIFTRVDE